MFVFDIVDYTADYPADCVAVSPCSGQPDC